MRAWLRLWPVLHPGTSVAQNGYSCIDAEHAATRHALATARPQAACADLAALSTASTTTRCRDHSRRRRRAGALPRQRVAPQIRFEVYLPSAWNRRFYMFGNGG